MSKFKVGDRAVVSDQVTFGDSFKSIRCTVTEEHDNHYAFVADAPIEDWHSGDYFTLYKESANKCLIPEHVYDSPLMKALR